MGIRHHVLLRVQHLDKIPRYHFDFQNHNRPPEECNVIILLNPRQRRTIPIFLVPVTIVPSSTVLLTVSSTDCVSFEFEDLPLTLYSATNNRAKSLPFKIKSINECK